VYVEALKLKLAFEKKQKRHVFIRAGDNFYKKREKSKKNG